MDEEISKKTCMKEKEKRGGFHQPLSSTWIADRSSCSDRMQESLCWESI
jgi:hypothetical protein